MRQSYHCLCRGEVLFSAAPRDAPVQRRRTTPTSRYACADTASRRRRPEYASVLHEEDSMAVLKGLGVALIVIWLVLWLAVKITFAAVHLLLLVGLAMIVFGFLKSKTANP
jgi:Flp pilus assembly protein TadB